MSTLRVWSMTRERLRNAYGQFLRYGELRHLTSKIRTKTQRAKTSCVGKSGRRVLSQERGTRQRFLSPPSRFRGSRSTTARLLARSDLHRSQSPAVLDHVIKNGSTLR